MTNHYDELRVSPDPEQAEELRQRLHARLASGSNDAPEGGATLHLEPVHPLTDGRSGATELSTAGASTSRDRTDRWRLVAAAAAVVAMVVGAATVALRDQGSDDKELSVTGTTPPPGDAIVVTADVIQLGDGLVGMGSVVKDGSRLYVLAGHVRDEQDLLFEPESAVLAAFDDAGEEQWRTELDAAPSGVLVLDGEPLVSHEDGTLSRIDPSDGRVVDEVDLGLGDLGGTVRAFGSLWLQRGDVADHGDPNATPPQLVRIDPDLSAVTIDLPAGRASGNSPDGVAAGPDAMWVPLKQGGVAVVDPDSNELTVIPVEDIGHEVTRVAFDGEAAYVASDDQVTSIVRGEALATVALGKIRYLGPIDGTFGALLDDGVGTAVSSGAGGTGQFDVLRATDPMVVEHRQLSIPEQARGGLFVIDGDTWWEIGRNYSLRRIELLAAPDER